MVVDRGDFVRPQMRLGRLLLEAPEVKVPEWQSMDVADKPMGITHELQNVVIECPIGETMEQLQREITPNLPWAEEHFQERVSGIPYNPPPSAANWPFTQGKHKDVTDKHERFSHTYPERMWPKHANRPENMFIHGVRYNYGDLQDVVNQLRKSPLTRQAYLPIWFPEDTGAVEGQRVPCTLGYHFLIRDGKLNVTYFIRSCDFLRHFPDDVYMAMRLGQWVRGEVMRHNRGIAGVSEQGTYPVKEYEEPLLMGALTMHMISLHVFGGDMHVMRKRYA